MNVAVIDNGGQYTHLIWRTVRDFDHTATIYPNTTPLEKIDADCVILSGGPGSAYKDDLGVCVPLIHAAVEGRFPLLGICLGHQLIAHTLGGVVAKGSTAEYGIQKIIIDDPDVLFVNVPSPFNAWVSHFDEVKKLPLSFSLLAHSETCPIEAMRHIKHPVFGVQFHPEVWHTEHQETIFENFLKVSHR